MKQFNWTKLAVLSILSNEAASYLVVAFMDYIDGKFSLGSAWCAFTAALYCVTMILVFFKWRRGRGI